MKTVYMNWQLGNTFGWGILGLNIFSHWANDAAIFPVMGNTIRWEDVEAVDPLRMSRIIEPIKRSNRYLDSLAKGGDARAKIPGTVIDPLGDGLNGSVVRGERTIGRAIFENTDVADAAKKLSSYDAILCGSNWNAELLRSRAGQPVKVIFEGVDPSLFCPGPKSGLLDGGKFYIFSGGKIEYRKGQDLVLLAFREFAKNHDDAMLVTAWHSPWPQLSTGFRGKLAVALEKNQEGALNIKKWAGDNGINPDKVVDIGLVRNHLMPPILREMDVSLQPSRAEACTNLPVKEAMACGLPAIVGDNTGMKDLITADNCVPLRSQRWISGYQGGGTEGWGESDIEEILAALEAMYCDRDRRLAIGQQAAAWIRADRTWQHHAARLKEFVFSID